MFFYMQFKLCNLQTTLASRKGNMEIFPERQGNNGFVYYTFPQELCQSAYSTTVLKAG